MGLIPTPNIIGNGNSICNNRSGGRTLSFNQSHRSFGFLEYDVGFVTASNRRAIKSVETSMIFIPNFSTSIKYTTFFESLRSSFLARMQTWRPRASEKSRSSFGITATTLPLTSRAPKSYEFLPAHIKITPNWLVLNKCSIACVVWASFKHEPQRLWVPA